MKDQTRRFETTIEIEALPDDVWRAITEAESLVRWFAFDAEVAPGVDGRIRLSWGGAWEWDSRIRIWEPRRRLRLTNEQSGSYDLEGRPRNDARPLEIALDYELEGHGGGTRLRLVHSGFGADAAWDDEFDGISRGWPFELYGLKHYLERHRGETRRVAWARTTAELPPERAWAVLTGPRAIVGGGGARRAGDIYEVRTAAGDAFSGVVQVALPYGFLGTAREWNDGLLRVSTDVAGGRTSLDVFVSTWSVPAERMDAVRERTQRMLEDVVRAEAGVTP